MNEITYLIVYTNWKNREVVKLRKRVSRKDMSLFLAGRRQIYTYASGHFYKLNRCIVS